MAQRSVFYHSSRRILEGEFWTSRQRQSHSIHYSVSYRASFKPELPSFFFSEFLTKKGSVILDPFGGRGTTAIQANLEGHYAIHTDISPLSFFLGKSRSFVPGLDQIQTVLESKLFSRKELLRKVPEEALDESLLAFYHKDTLRELKNFKRICRENSLPELPFIQMTALSRLHGHSDGFFSVYSFPQVSIPAEQQRKNNHRKKLNPEYKSIIPRILQKAKRDLSCPLPPFYHEFSSKNRYYICDARELNPIASNSVDLVVTSPPFLDKVDYLRDNWIRHWFLDISPESIQKISIFSSIEAWSVFLRDTLHSLSRVVKPGGYIVIEVGEVKKGKKILSLDEYVLEAGLSSGLDWNRTYINNQKFTKLSNCWNVSNNEKGTNSNRCVVLQKP